MGAHHNGKELLAIQITVASMSRLVVKKHNGLHAKTNPNCHITKIKMNNLAQTAIALQNLDQYYGDRNIPHRPMVPELPAFPQLQQSHVAVPLLRQSHGATQVTPSTVASQRDFGRPSTIAKVSTVLYPSLREQWENLVKKHIKEDSIWREFVLPVKKVGPAKFFAEPLFVCLFVLFVCLFCHATQLQEFPVIF